MPTIDQQLIADLGRKSLKKYVFQHLDHVHAEFIRFAKGGCLADKAHCPRNLAQSGKMWTPKFNANCQIICQRAISQFGSENLSRLQ
jgi:hypothetical protein